MEPSTRGRGPDGERSAEVADLPDDRRYTSEHEWAKAEDGRVTVGITDYAQDQLGDVESSPELINSDPYGGGWLVVIEPAGGGLDHLLDAGAYRALTEGEGGVD